MRSHSMDKRIAKAAEEFMRRGAGVEGHPPGDMF